MFFRFYDVFNSGSVALHCFSSQIICYRKIFEGNIFIPFSLILQKVRYYTIYRVSFKKGITCKTGSNYDQCQQGQNVVYSPRGLIILTANFLINLNKIYLRLLMHFKGFYAKKRRSLVYILRTVKSNKPNTFLSELYNVVSV